MSPNADRSRRFFRFPWRSPTRIREDVDDELRFHLDMRTAELVASGMSEVAARREATREIGGVDFTRRSCRRLDEANERATPRGEWLTDARQALPPSLRALPRSAAVLAIPLLTSA